MTVPAGGDFHDLPPKWDGQPVTWQGWRDLGPVFICDRSRRTAPPPWCGCGDSGSAVQTNAGLIDGTLALMAQRCPTCGCDYVTEFGEPASVWTLDWPADYGDDGSVP